MSQRLALYGSVKHALNVAKVGGKGKTPPSLAARMPSAELAAKVGPSGISGAKTRRVVRRSARA